ncbi:methyltransferase domain-containing protein [Candidatus Omnitrophota bacterium]
MTVIVSKEIVEQEIKKITSARDKEFFSRIYQTPSEVYEQRLRNIGFIDQNSVVDAGCGYGQWSVLLARLNKKVYAIELDNARFEIAREVGMKSGVTNCEYFHTSIENTKLADASIDAIFCYSAIYYTNFFNTLKEFYRILRPGGTLYFSTNGLGWYLYNIVEAPYSTDGFSPRRMAIDALKNSLFFYSLGKLKPSASLVMPRKTVKKKLTEIGYVDIEFADEACIILPKGREVEPFFEGRYYGCEGVYEVLCKKS